MKFARNLQLFGQALLASAAFLAAGVANLSAATPDQAQADVDALLAAGEIGAAADLAAQTEGITRSELNKRIMLNQFQAGGAVGLVRPGARERHPTEDQNPEQHGGSIADFASLINLISRETSGPWEDIDGEGGTITQFDSGVSVNPNGVLVRESREDATGRLARLGTSARVAALNEEMARPATLRLVSLTRLEREVARRVAEGKPVVESMRQLAGLSQIQYVFVYPAEHEIVLGGPAEGWSYNQFGMPVGTQSNRPTLQLDDLVTVLRTFSPAGQKIFGCSIDPQSENLKAVKEYAAASQSRGPLSSAGVRSWGNQIGKILGLQNITVYGVPADSRVARVLVEADYRMKLIGIGKLDAGARIPDYFDLLAKQPQLASGGLDAMRWWMTMKYEAVLHSPDLNAFEIRGSAVQCKSENQFLADSGERVSTGQAEPINQLFAANFTDHYAELAQRDPIFADLQGIFDLALVAAMIQQDRLDERADWDRGAFAIDGDYRPATYASPRQTESVVNHRVYRGTDVVLQVAGGVRGDVASALKVAGVQQESPRLGAVAESARPKELPAGRWWWDAQ